MATENIKYRDGVDFGLAMIPTGNQPLDARTIVTSLPTKASDFTGNAAYEGMIVSLLPDHKLFMLTSSFEDILAGNDLVWKEVGPSLEGYATVSQVDTAKGEAIASANEYTDAQIAAIPEVDLTSYAKQADLESLQNSVIENEKVIAASLTDLDGRVSTLNSNIYEVEEKANAAQNAADAAQNTADDANSLAQTAYNIAYTIAYGEGVADAIDTIKDITYWLNNDPDNAVDLINRMSKVEEELSSLENSNNSIDLGDEKLWRENQTGDALIVIKEGETEKEILSIQDYTDYVKKLTWTII